MRPPPAPAAVADVGVVWPGRRQPTRHERLLVGGLAVLLAGYLVATVGGADWTQHPWIAALGVVFGAASLALLIACGWLSRLNRSSLSVGPSLRELSRPTRRALRRELRTGRPGPPELRPYAVTWVAQGLQSPRSQVPVLAVAAGNAGVSATGPIATLTLVLLVLVPVLATFGVIDWAMRRRDAGRVADALDLLTAPSHLSTSADSS